jgi:4-hydroxybenzoate polyprenyltransferase
MIDLFRLCRPYYAVPMSLILTLTIWYAMGDAIVDHRRAAWYATLSLALVISGAYVLNDVCDRRVDRVNAPHRPVSAGRVSPVVAAIWGAGLTLGGLGVATLCRWQFLVLLACIAAVVTLYNLSSKRLGVFKQLTVSALMISFYPLAFAQAGGITSSRTDTLYVFPIWLFLTSFGYETLKDLRDIPGDQSAAISPTWLQRHPSRALAVARITVISGALVLLGPAFCGCGWVYLLIFPSAIFLAIWSAFLPRRRAMLAIYGECVMVGIATTADIMVLGS